LKSSGDVNVPITELVGRATIRAANAQQFNTTTSMGRGTTAAMRCVAAGRTVRVAWAPEGKNSDDLLREAA
jgi:hypothetical protein